MLRTAFSAWFLLVALLVLSKCLFESENQDSARTRTSQPRIAETVLSVPLPPLEVVNRPHVAFAQTIQASAAPTDVVAHTNFKASTEVTSGLSARSLKALTIDSLDEKLPAMRDTRSPGSVTIDPKLLEPARLLSSSGHVAIGRTYSRDRNDSDRVVLNRNRVNRLRSPRVESGKTDETGPARPPLEYNDRLSPQPLVEADFDNESEDNPPNETQEDLQSILSSPIVADSPDTAPATMSPDTGAAADSVPEANPKQSVKTQKPKRLSPRMAALKTRIHRTLEAYYFDQLDASERSPWAIMHSLIAYGVDTEIRRDYADQRGVNAIGWLCFNGRGAGESLFYLSDGQIRARTGPGLQGHEGQFLAMLAQSKVKREYPMKVGNHELTVDDLIEYEMQTCYRRTELTFKLIALVHYLPLDAEWKNDRDENWDLPLIIHEELAQPVRGAACGGTHRIMGFSYAVRQCQRKGGKIEGEWRRAKKFVDDYHKYAFSLQNRDGSFSSNWFEGRGDWGDSDRKLQTTGHILEWLVFSLPDERLSDSRIIRSVEFLTNLLLENQGEKLEIGPQGHALHALALYENRVFGAAIGDYRSRFVNRTHGNKQMQLGRRNWLERIFE